MIRLTGLGSFYKAGCTAVIGCFFHRCDWRISILDVSELFPWWSAVIWLSGCSGFLFVCLFFFYNGHPHFRVLYSSVPADVVRVKS